MKKYTIEIGRNLSFSPLTSTENKSERLGIICVDGKFYESTDYSITQYNKHVVDFYIPDHIPFPPTSGRTTFTWQQIAMLIQDLKAHDTGYDSVKKIITMLKSIKSADITVIDKVEKEETYIITALKDFKLAPNINFSVSSITNITNSMDINGKIFEPHEYNITGYTTVNISNATCIAIIDKLIDRETNLILYHDIPPLIDFTIDEYYQEKFKKGKKDQEALDEVIDFIFSLQYVKAKGAILIDRT